MLGKLFDFTIYNELEILLNVKQTAEICHGVLDDENYIQYVGRQKPLNRQHLMNEKASFSCILIKHNFKFNNPCVHIHVWLSAIDESSHHPTGPESLHNSV